MIAIRIRYHTLHPNFIAYIRTPRFELPVVSTLYLVDCNAATARNALERVGSGKDSDSLPQYYSQEFVDHVNSMKSRGLEGARRSVELYTKILSDPDITVKEQLLDRCVSSWVSVSTVMQ